MKVRHQSLTVSLLSFSEINCICSKPPTSGLRRISILVIRAQPLFYLVPGKSTEHMQCQKTGWEAASFTHNYWSPYIFFGPRRVSHRWIFAVALWLIHQHSRWSLRDLPAQLLTPFLRWASDALWASGLCATTLHPQTGETDPLCLLLPLESPLYCQN